MTVVARLEAILTAQTKEFEAAMTRSETRMHKAGKVAGVAGLAIAGGLAFGLEKSVKAALDAQASQARLSQAFANAHLNAKLLEPQIEKVETASRKLGFTEEDVHKALASLVTSTGNYRDAVKQMGIAQDLARFKGVGLEQATKALTMAHAGSLRPLKQLGIDIPKVTTAQDALKKATKDHTTAAYAAALADAKLQDKSATFANVLQVTTDKVHGQADAYSKTAAGAMEQFKAQLNFLEISLGTALLPALTKVSEAAAKMTEWLTAHPKLAKVLIVSLGGLAAALLAASVAQRILNVVVATNPYVAAIIALVAIGVALYVFRDKLKVVYDWIKQNWPLLVGILTGGIGLAVAEIVQHRDRLIAIFRNLPGQIAAVFTAGIGAVKDAITGLFGKVIGWVKDVLGIGSPSKVFYEIGQHSIQGFINGVGSMGGILKKAVVGMVHDAVGAVKHLPGELFGAGGQGHAPPGARGRDIRSGYQKIASDVGAGHAGVAAQVDAAVGYAMSRGWRGTITSAVRTYAEQSALYQRYLHGGPLAAPPGHSSHESGTAVDVTDYGTFGRIMASAPSWAKLFNHLGSRDPVHYSISGYDTGGWLPTGLSLAWNNTGRPERVLGPGEGGHTFVFNFPQFAGSKQELMSLMRQAAEQFGRRNAKPAFG